MNSSNFSPETRLKPMTHCSSFLSNIRYMANEHLLVPSQEKVTISCLPAGSICSLAIVFRQKILVILWGLKIFKSSIVGPKTLVEGRYCCVLFSSPILKFRDCSSRVCHNISNVWIYPVCFFVVRRISQFPCRSITQVYFVNYVFVAFKSFCKLVEEHLVHPKCVPIPRCKRFCDVPDLTDVIFTKTKSSLIQFLLRLGHGKIWNRNIARISNIPTTLMC
mmetsp:Transcript_1161/g.1875  ORF Transcript_1161/g.1875 Transcript_1161/m.1875 type:complete len:220 (+) Transcript_1161:446-1105(+)